MSKRWIRDLIDCAAMHMDIDSGKQLNSPAAEEGAADLGGPGVVWRGRWPEWIPAETRTASGTRSSQSEAE